MKRAQLVLLDYLEDQANPVWMDLKETVVTLVCQDLVDLVKWVTKEKEECLVRYLDLKSKYDKIIFLSAEPFDIDK